MFYKNEKYMVRAAIVLTPAESKQLIAKAVRHTPEIKTAMVKGVIIIAGGSTNAYVARELTEDGIDLNRYVVGKIHEGEFRSTPEEERLKPIILIKGQKSEIPIPEILENFTSDDVFVKGANAVDCEGNVAVLAANRRGGTVGVFWALVKARGAHMLCPVGLEKLIPSVVDASRECGQQLFKYSTGLKTGLLPLPGAKVITEIEAFKILFDVDATHIASGGIGGSEGSVALSVKGDENKIETMWDTIQSIKQSKSS